MIMMKRILILAVALACGAVFAQARPNGLMNRRNMRRGNAAANANAQQAADQSAANQRAREAAEAGGRSIEFDQVPVDLVYQVYGNLVNKTIIADPNAPKATITLKPQKGQELTDEDKIHAIETVLEMNQIHLEPYGDKFIRAIPRKEVRKEGIPLIMDPEADFGESTKVVSFMIALKNIAAEDAQKILDQFKSASGLLIAIERNNTILLTDTEANINRMREIIKVIDVASPVTEVVEYIQIKNASANDIKEVLDSIVQESQKEQEGNKAPKNNTVSQPNSAFQPRRLLGGNNKQAEVPHVNESLLMSISDADRGMIRGKVVTIADERSNKILIITNASNMKFFKDVIAALDVETTPDTVVKVYRLKYAEAEDVSDMINDLIGNSSASKNSGKSNQNQNAKNGTSGSTTRGTQTTAKKPANQRTGESKAGELSKENTTVLADKRINGLVVMTDKELIPTIESIIDSMDIKLAQVLIETCIIEVTLGDGLKTGVDWVKLGRHKETTQLTDKLGNKKFKVYTKGSTDDDGNYTAGTDTGISMTAAEFAAAYGDGSDSNLQLSEVAATITKTVTGGFWSTKDKGFQLGGGGGTGSTLLSTLSGANSSSSSSSSSSDDDSTVSASDVADIALNPIGGGINYFFKSDKLNLGAVIQASQNDSHSKYIASPIVMTLDNKEANVEATSSRQFLTGWQAVSSSYAGSGLPSPTYTAKDIGIKLKITPKINPNGTVMLEVEEEYSQVSGTQTMLTPVGQTYQNTDIDVPVTRKMSSDVLLENGQTVVFGGLTERLTSSSETGIPILKDIPYIGKWLFGSVSEEETRVELLVFMTPYVLTDAQAAQLEALRRKKSMSDARPWEDNGWSASNLADPVSKKEQMRRLKDEWKKQDEERQTRMAIEQEKIKRAKALQEMSVEERKVWLEMHKDELEKEQQDDLEKKMLDKDSQEELRKLADQIRKEKLSNADAALKKNEEETRAQNERGKLDAEKKAAQEAESKETKVKPIKEEETK